MAITLDELGRKLAEVPGFKPLPGPEPGTKLLMFRTKEFTNTMGEKKLYVIVRLEEDGEYISIFSPIAMTARGSHADDVIKACAMVQWKTKLIQFEYDDGDGEIRPVIEWPVEDGTVTSKQLGRAVLGLVQIMDRFYPVIKRAGETGAVDFDLADRQPAPPPRRPPRLPAETRRKIEDMLDELDRDRDDPGRSRRPDDDRDEPPMV